jgi:hypothetical protein
MRSFISVIVATACVTAAPRLASAQEKPRLLEIAGFMSKGVFTELDPDQMNARLSAADIERLHFDGHSTEIDAVLGYMARAEKMKYKIAEPLEVRGEIPVTLPLNATGREAYTTCFHAFNLNGLAVAGSGDSLILIRPETRPEAPKLDRKWNREQILSIRLFRLGYLNSDLVLAQYKDKIGTKGGRAILEPKSNMVIIADKTGSLAKLQYYIDTETLESMGVPAGAGRTPADGLKTPSLGAIAGRDNLHFYLVAFARVSRFAMRASKTERVFDKYYPEAGVWMAEQVYRALEGEYNRINEYYQLALKNNGQGWPVPPDERTLSPAQQNKLDIHFGVINSQPPNPPPAKSKMSKKGARKR